LDLDGDSSTIIDFSDKTNIKILRKGKGYNYLLHMLDICGINVR
jgi:tRNA A37 threonylcarbamoyladenosine synthetase subunit TsaC/SUA5/YrdC